MIDTHKMGRGIGLIQVGVKPFYLDKKLSVIQLDHSIHLLYDPSLFWIGNREWLADIDTTGLE